MSLKLATQVRNKIVNAYQDIARMQIWSLRALKARRWLKIAPLQYLA
jgi:hypothetical protein